ncbi:MAG: response regulator transcription factor [Chitinophagaceae bacterium]|nr:response regulator transcription factor [Chitinophagaceae bacterium]MBK9486916.1 response regulator transcription factor [Chitinophagaceae bacterium]MBL0202527.1 response regulator transcription factor [Chitinophagaceae bacterium]
MIKILIVDDEQSAGRILKVLLEKHIPGDKKIEISNKPAAALELLETFKPSLVMLDIEMPGMNGFDFLNRASQWDFDVIFTTAYDQYAIKAIRFSALDYLLKPIDIIDLKNAVNRHIVKKQSASESTQQPLVDNLIYNLKQKDFQQFKLALSTSDGIFLHNPHDIIVLEGSSNYTKFCFSNQKSIIVSKTLKEYEDILLEHGFLRVHKSYLVNKNHVIKVDKEAVLELSNQMHIPVSRRRKAEILQWFNQS